MNIIFVYCIYIYLGDFGISKITKTPELTASTFCIAGSVLYMAPEIWKEQPYLIFIICNLCRLLFFFLLVAIQNRIFGHWECYYSI
jgi:serine/threonine protein kinase